MLELNQVTKVFRLGVLGRKALTAVDRVSFKVDYGEVVALIGESGSGKTTIGKMILRLMPVTSGVILFEGQDISKFRGEALKEYYRKVQGVFQDPFSSYNPVFKADRIFRIMHKEFFPKLGLQEWQTRVKEILCAVGLAPEEVLGKYPHQLSGGQLQRLLIARALLLEIYLLVADEIISMLDASTRVDILNLLADLKQQRGLSVLFITHDLALAHYISDEAVILYRGNVVERGDITKVFNNPVHPYTQMLLLAVPRLDRKWEDVEMQLKAQSAPLPQGCVYYHRCSFSEKEELCAHEKPELVEVESGHFVACHRVSKVRKGVKHAAGKASGTSAP